MCLRGAIDSPDIPLNVSRSSLQMDKTVRQLSSHISKKVADKLATLYQTEKEKFYAAWPEIEMIVKLGMLQDEKFYTRAKDFLIWKTTAGAWTTLDEKTGTLFYTSDAHASILELYKEKEVVLSTSPIDTHLFSSLERKLSLKFQRVDGALNDSLLDSSREKTESNQIADFFRKALPDLEIEAKSLASTSLPTLLIVDENTRRMRDSHNAMGLSGHAMPTFQAKKTFVVNTNNPLIESLYHMQESQPELASDVAHHLYELSLLAQKEIDPAKMSAFITRSTQVLEKLLKKSDR
jgi:molecular chaperone HtpG